ncbi:fibrillin-1-like, partial, partial [Paramuricea clavata]
MAILADFYSAIVGEHCRQEIFVVRLRSSLFFMITRLFQACRGAGTEIHKMELTVKGVVAIFACFLAVFTQTISANANYSGNCETPIDVAFLMDSSGSLGRSNYNRLKETVYNMGTYFGVSPMGSHASIILYSDYYEIASKFDQFMTIGQFRTTVLRLKYLSQRSRMDASLTAAQSQIFTRKGNTRDFLPKVAILFTDGKQSRFRDRVPLPEAARKLRENGVNIFVIGIGSGPSKSELESMVVDRENHIYRSQNFRDLKDQSEAVAGKICELFGARKRDVSPNPVDIGFLLHGADSLSKKDRNKAKQFISSVATTLGIEVPNSRAALLQYNEGVGSVFTFSKYTDLTNFYDNLHRLPVSTGKNQIDVAIREASKQIFSSESRLAVSRVAVLLTFGKPLNIQQAQIAVIQLRSKGVKLFVVHVGSAREMTSLRKLVSNKHNLFHANTIDDLMDLVIPLHDKIVNESVPTAKELSSVPASYSTIRVKWIPAFDPNEVISGYEVQWTVIEDDKGLHIINSPLQSSGVLPADVRGYEISGLTPYTLYKIHLIPQWQAGVRGDIPDTQSRTLEDIDECLTDPCDVNAKCTNTKRSFSCKCNIGYSGDGFSCTDDNECRGSPCDANGICTNTIGSFKCACDKGYSGDGFSCIDINECLGNPCDVNAKCDNSPGSFSCTCNIGYSGDGFACNDIDECQGSPCDVNGKCSNNPGSFECECNIGYSGNGFSCTDIDECQGSPCDANGKCSNNPGSFECECNIGYSGNGFTCTDNNECLRGPCDDNAVCGNTDGSYSCTCRKGYSGNGFFCA